MTAAALIQSLPQRMKVGAGQGIDLLYHFKISGEHGGDFTVKVKDGVCSVEKGLSGDPKCEIEAMDTVYEDVEMGRTNAQMAVLFGKLKVSNIPSLLKFVEMFERAV
ncbi:MAG: SCP2 sterol-binding domain-containing protein [Chitinophagaceae bacterium]|nr:SCP2 sterol-binding domain-containing protein [Chitinophagaceae bacterium]